MLMFNLKVNYINTIVTDKIMLLIFDQKYVRSFDEKIKTKISIKNQKKN